MTQDMMTLRALLEKSSDADLLCEMIGFTGSRRGCGHDGGQVRAKVNETGLGKPASERRAFKLA